MLRLQTDARLVDLTRAGNDRAFEAIVERYHRPLLRLCRRLLGDGRAEDVLQQALTQAYSALHRNEARSRPAAVAVPGHPQRGDQRVAPAKRAGSTRSRKVPAARRSPQRAPIPLRPPSRERLRAVVEAVKLLPERQRAAILLRELEGRSYEEIASELGVGPGAVRQLLNRARPASGRRRPRSLLPGCSSAPPPTEPTSPSPPASPS